jgi:NADH-quinone oxidoreductase subunit N
MNVGTFAFILMMEKDGQPVVEISALNQYAKAEPGRALAVLVLFFSLAGVPPMLGFFGKFYVLRAAYEADLIWLAVLGVIASVIGAYYYLRIVYFMYFGDDGDEGLNGGRNPVLSFMLTASAALMIVAILPFVNMLGVDAAAAAAAQGLVR